MALVAATFERDAVDVELGAGFETRGGLGFDSPFQGLSARCPAVLDGWWMLVSVVGLVIAVGYLVRRRRGSPIASTVATAAIAVALLTPCPIPILHLGVYLPAIPLTRGRIVAAVLPTGILLLIAGGYVWYRTSGAAGRTGDDTGDRPEEPELSRIGDAAGTVADRIEAPEVTDNQV